MRALDQSVAAELARLTEIIKETVPVETIYLFGSYAYGVPHKDSDIDLYVVMKDSAPYLPLDAMLMIGEAIHGNKTMPTDILVLKKSRFQYRLSAPTLEREVAEKGVVLYAAAAIWNDCNILNQYSVLPRYPEELEISEDAMKQALKSADAVLDFVRPLYTKPGGP